MIKQYKIGEENSYGQKFLGWICRTWTETSMDGWTSEFERFDTEEEAYQYGYTHNNLISIGELAREFEVYKDFSSPF